MMRRLLRIALPGIMIFVLNHAHAQQVSVYDRVTLETLPGVTIHSSGGIVAATDQNGHADISAFRDKAVIMFSMVGYEMESVSYSQIKELGWKVAMTEKSFYIGEVVVSASRFEEKKEDVAQQIQLLDSRDIRFLNQQSTADLLQQSGNVLVQKSQQGGGSPIIRGFEANKVLIVVDGVRMNNAIYRGGHLQDVITLDNTAMDKVEIVYGPGSVVYGSDALGGVMHFYTRNPEFSGNDSVLFRGNAFLRHSTVNGELSGHVDFNLGGKRLASMTSVTYSDFGDLRQGNVRSPFMLGYWGRTEYVERINGIDSIVTNQNPNIQVGSGYKQYDVLQKLAFRQNGRVRHTLNLQLSNSGNVPRYDRLTQYRNGSLRFAEWYYGPQQRFMGAYHLEIADSNSLFDHARVILSMQDIQQSRYSRSYRNDWLNGQVENVTVLALNADLAKELGHHELRYGVEAAYNDVESLAEAKNIVTGNVQDISTRYPDGGSATRSFSAYVTHSWELNEMLVVSDGLRFTSAQLTSNFNDTTFFPFPFKKITQNNQALNGNLGLVFKPGHNWKISLFGGTGFRVPNVDDLTKVFESTGATRDDQGNLIELGNLIIPNPDLKPERTYSLDFAVSKTIDKKVTLESTAFYTIYSDAITTGYGTLNGSNIVIYDGDSALVSTSVNQADGYIYGCSGQFSARVTRSLDISSSLNYTYGRFKEAGSGETPLDHIPPVFGRTGLNLQVQKFRGEFWVMYNGWKRLEDYRLGAEDNEANATAMGMPAWYTLNVRTSFAINELLSVQVALENILDQNYRVFASNISAPGRNLMATFRARF